MKNLFRWITTGFNWYGVNWVNCQSGSTSTGIS